MKCARSAFRRLKRDYFIIHSEAYFRRRSFQCCSCLLNLNNILLRPIKDVLIIVRMFFIRAVCFAVCYSTKFIPRFKLGTFLKNALSLVAYSGLINYYVQRNTNTNVQIYKTHIICNVYMG